MKWNIEREIIGQALNYLSYLFSEILEIDLE